MEQLSFVSLLSPTSKFESSTTKGIREQSSLQSLTITITDKRHKRTIIITISVLTGIIIIVIIAAYFICINASNPGKYHVVDLTHV
jgi:hypothetical protein